MDFLIIARFDINKFGERRRLRRISIGLVKYVLFVNGTKDNSRLIGSTFLNSTEYDDGGDNK